MSSGIDKLVVTCVEINKDFRILATMHGRPGRGYRHVIDLRQTGYQYPVQLYCYGRRNGIHKIEFVGVARLGLRRTKKILNRIVGDLSKARIFRIDLCTDIASVGVLDLAEIVSVSRTQNFRIYKTRGGASFYLQNSSTKTVLLYDKLKQLAAEGDPLADAYKPSEQLTRIEVQLKGRGVPFKKISQLHRYADVDPLGQLHFRRLRKLPANAKPLHRLAARGLRRWLHKYGLQAVKKQFSSSHWAYIEKNLFSALEGEEIPDIRLRLKCSIEDWLNDRIRFPRFPGSDGEK